MGAAPGRFPHTGAGLPGRFPHTRAGLPDAVWRDTSFRGYAGHTRSAEFVAAMDELLDGAAREGTAVMCAEAVWWRCRRRLVTDFAVPPATPLWTTSCATAASLPHPGCPRADGLLVDDDVEAAGPAASGTGRT